ncbi:cytochrome oxidase putative small subunit CydP [Acidovorax sp. M2(2025)]|uniref:cytochrome oxidase putative small subunit CydP n=1 Tax=Acidovorax sp. M2(2025) TaxID=3411355 RepID=UPI003BF57F2E
MNPIDRRLWRYLMHAVLIKLAVLVLLWWVFVRDARVPVDADAAARQAGAAAVVSTEGASQ